jgi:hypothetical protein
LNVAGMDITKGNVGMANAALNQYQSSLKASGMTAEQADAASRTPGTAGTVSPMRPLDPATGRPVQVTEAGIPLTNPFARQVEIPELGIKPDDSTLDVIARLSEGMHRKDVSVQTASRLYDVQQQLWEGYKSMIQAVTQR